MALALEKRNANTFAVGSFDAKTHFAELLRTVESGATVTITRNGHDIATMISPKTAQNNKNLASLAAWKKLRKIAAKQENSQKITQKITIEEIQEWKNEGRK